MANDLNRPPVILLNMAVDVVNKWESEIIFSNYVSMVSDAGAVPVCMPSIEKEQNIETLLELSRRGMGITFYPHSLQTYSASKKFEGLHIVKVSYGTKQAIGVGHLKNRFLSQAAKDFINILKEVIQ